MVLKKRPFAALHLERGSSFDDNVANENIFLAVAKIHALILQVKCLILVIFTMNI